MCDSLISQAPSLTKIPVTPPGRRLEVVKVAEATELRGRFFPLQLQSFLTLLSRGTPWGLTRRGESKSGSNRRKPLQETAIR